MQQTDRPVAPQDAGPASAPAAGPGAAASPARRKPPVVAIAVVTVALAVGAVFGGQWYMHKQAFVSTDDAQVAGNLVTLSARVSGRVARLLVEEGQTVQAGQVLAELEQEDFKAQLAQAEAALAVAMSNIKGSQGGVSLQRSQTNAQVAQARSSMNAAQANMATAQANAEKAQADLAKLANLYRDGGVSQQAFEAAQTAAKSADSAVRAARSQAAAAADGVNLALAGNEAVSIKQAGVETAQAQVAQAKAAVETAKLQLAHAVLTAPANGIIARRVANVGEQVSPGQGLYSLAETDQVWVNANIEETNIRRVHDGADVEVHIDAFPSQTFKGHVVFVNAVTGASFSLLPANNASGNFTKVVQRLPVKITVDDPQRQLKPGMSAVIDIAAR